jgi:hypothetical protein
MAYQTSQRVLECFSAVRRPACDLDADGEADRSAALWGA